MRYLLVAFGPVNLADAIEWAGAGFVGIGGCLSITTIFRPAPGRDHVADGLSAVGFWLAFLGSVVDTSPFWTAVFGLCAAYYTWRWWKNRRNGRWRKALRKLGAKSKARVQALVDRMTPSPIPTGGGAS